MKIIILSLLLIISTTSAKQEDDKDKMDILTGCWMLSVAELSAKSQEIDLIVAKQPNRQQVLEKMQSDMIRKCFSYISLEDANEVINSLTDPTVREITYSDIVTDFKFTEYKNPDRNYQFDQYDHKLKLITEELERTMTPLFQKLAKAATPKFISTFGFSSEYILYGVIAALFILSIVLSQKGISSKRNQTVQKAKSD